MWLQSRQLSLGLSISVFIWIVFIVRRSERISLYFIFASHTATNYTDHTEINSIFYYTHGKKYKLNCDWRYGWVLSKIRSENWTPEPKYQSIGRFIRMYDIFILWRQTLMQLQNKHIRMMVKIFSLAIENQIPQLKQKQEF